MKKFELTREFVTSIFGVKLFRIRALRDFGTVKVGDKGGYIEKEENLSQDGTAWVIGNAKVSGDARVSGDAQVSGNAWVSGNAQVCGDARVSGDAQVCGNAKVSGDACVSGTAWVIGNAKVSGDAQVCGDARVSGDAQVSGNADYATVKGFGRNNRCTTFFRCKDGKVCVVCGCFVGELEEFREIVKRTHGNGKMATEYLMIADLMETHFKEEY